VRFRYTSASAAEQEELFSSGKVSTKPGQLQRICRRSEFSARIPRRSNSAYIRPPSRSHCWNSSSKPTRYLVRSCLIPRWGLVRPGSPPPTPAVGSLASRRRRNSFASRERSWAIHNGFRLTLDHAKDNTSRTGSACPGPHFTVPERIRGLRSTTKQRDSPYTLARIRNRRRPRCEAIRSQAAPAALHWIAVAAAIPRKFLPEWES
jgi:hypothetical protein